MCHNTHDLDAARTECRNFPNKDVVVNDVVEPYDLLKYHCDL